MADQIGWIRSFVPEEGVEDTSQARRKIRGKLRKGPFEYASAHGVGFTLDGVAFKYETDGETLKVIQTEEKLDTVKRERTAGGGTKRKRKARGKTDYATQIARDPTTAGLTDEEYIAQLFELIAKDEKFGMPTGEFNFEGRYYAFSTAGLRAKPPSEAANYILRKCFDLGLLERNPNAEMVIIQTSPRFTSYKSVGIGPV